MTYDREQAVKLSKSRFLSGLQCLKRLYLETYHRDMMPALEPGQQAIMEAGMRIGEVARGLRPGGVLIADDYWHHEEAVEATRQAIEDGAVPAIYEAAFAYAGVRIRADILSRKQESGFELIEVKSGTRVKDVHLSDVAVQLYVLRGCGVPVEGAYVATIDNEYVYEGGDYDLEQLFRVEDVADRLARHDLDVPGRVDMMRAVLREDEPPDILVGRHCSQPYDCPFHYHCSIGQTDYPVSQLPRANQALLVDLEAAGIDDIRDIPAAYSGLTPLQLRARDCVVEGKAHVDPKVLQELGRLEYPIHFLDFESFAPGLPHYPGTRPYQVMPFQWSNHIMEADGSLRHEEFLHTGPDDPSEAFALSLLDTLGGGGSIIAYSNFEALRIRELAARLPHLSDNLQSLLDGRIVDLLVLVRDHCYHPRFRGSFSLKTVLPAMVPDFTYADLEVKEGSQASATYMEIICPETTPERRDLLCRGLREYCSRDTMAMVELFRTLVDRSSGSSEC